MQLIPLTTLMANLDSGARPPGGAGGSGDGVPSLGAEHLAADGGFFLDNLKTVPQLFFNAMTKGRICAHDILIVKDGATTGKASLVSAMFPFKQAAVNEHVFRLTIDKSQAEPAYVFRFIASDVGKRQILKDFRGATVGGISRGFTDMVHIPIPFPDDTRRSLAEQKRIAGILDAADGLRSKRRESLAQLDTLLQSTFLDMFGDPVTNPRGWELSSGDRVSNRLTVGIVVKPASYYQHDGVPALRSLNVRANKIVTDPLVYFSQEDNEGRLKKTRVWKDDVLLVRSGQPGTAAIVPSELDGVNAIDILILTPDQEVVDPHYLCMYFNSAGGRRMALGAERGQIQKHLNVGALKTAPIPLPPLDLQHRFAAIVESIKQLKASQQAHLAELDTLFASLQSRAFRGGL